MKWQLGTTADRRKADKGERATESAETAPAPARATALVLGRAGDTPPAGDTPTSGGTRPMVPVAGFAEAQVPAVAPPQGAPPAGMGRIGDRLLDMGLISKDQLEVALFEKKNSNKMMGEILVDLGFISEHVLSTVLAESSGFERFDSRAGVADPEVLKRLPKEVAVRFRVFPVALDGNQLRLAMADVYDVLAMDQVRRYFAGDTEILPLVCSETEITQAIDQYYGHELSIDGILREIESGEADTLLVDAEAMEGQDSYLHPLVRLVNAILLDAVKVKASDLHFEPEGSFLRVRYRIDGVMTQIRTIHKEHWPAISHRLKIMSGMNIADKLNPQDGRMNMSVGNRKIDFRVSSLPTMHGENIVMRLLDKTAAQVPVTQLGFSEGNFDLLKEMIARPEGIIIVTGPTGSGKTTTLYAVMNYINSLDINIMTLEDPVEYELPLIRQSQVREGSQLTFAEGIRTLLRQDPDKILVGEVRDSDTATMALRAAMTGHQVYTTLHTNDAAGALPRLVDLGMKPSLMAGNIIGIVAQRLARKLCADCGITRPATVEECTILGLPPEDPPMVGAPVGCAKCRFTGYRGRTAVAEVIAMNPDLDELVIQNASLSIVRREARKFGFIPMAEDGRAKVLAGIMSVEGLVRTVDVSALKFHAQRAA